MIDDNDGDGGGGDADGNYSDCDDDGDSWMEGPLGGRGVMRWNLKSPPNEVTAVTNHPRRMSFDDKMMITTVPYPSFLQDHSCSGSFHF